MRGYISIRRDTLSQDTSRVEPLLAWMNQLVWYTRIASVLVSTRYRCCIVPANNRVIRWEELEHYDVANICVCCLGIKHEIASKPHSDIVYFRL